MNKSILTAIAPTLASALSGPFANTAANFLIEKLDLDSATEARKLQTILQEFFAHAAESCKNKRCRTGF